METFLKIIKQKYPLFEVDENNRPVLEKMLAWINSDSRKGFLLAGNYGNGKTVLMKALQYYLLMTQHTKMFNLRTAWSIANSYSLEGYTAIQDIPKVNYCFDELGIVERETVMHYGNKINVSDAIILDRFNLFVSNGITTHFTTNLHPDDFKKVYDGRTISRLNELCEIVIVKGQDKRGKFDDFHTFQKPIEKEEHKPLTGKEAEEKIKELNKIISKSSEEKQNEHAEKIREFNKNEVTVRSQLIMREFDEIFIKQMREKILTKEDLAGNRVIKVEGKFYDHYEYLKLRSNAK